MLFTPDTPAEPGGYWTRSTRTGRGDKRIVQVRDNEGGLETNVYGFWCPLANADAQYEWAGPIPEPTNA